MKKAILTFILALIIGISAVTAVDAGAVEPGEITIETESNLVIGTADGCITGIAPGTTAAALIANFENTSQLAVVNSQGGTVTGNIIVGTGYKLRLVIGGTSVDEYTLIVTGDADGDGEMSLKDAMHILRILAGWKLVNYDAASDFNGDGRMNARDAVQVLRKLADWNVDIYPLVNVRPPVKTYTVTFKDWDGSVIAERTGIVKGGSAVAPTEPTREGYDFAGWDKTFANITADTTVTATYIEETSEPRISVNGATASPGDDSINISLSIKNNPGILGMKLKLNYDSSNLTLTGSSNGAAFSALSMTKPGELVDGCNFVWDGQELDESDIKDGIILNLVFSANQNIPKGEYPIRISYTNGGIIDNNISSVTVTIVNAKIIIE